MKKLITLATFAAFASPLWAATQTVDLVNFLDSFDF